MAPDDVFLLLINPPSKNKPMQKLIAKYQETIKGTESASPIYILFHRLFVSSYF